MRLLVEEANAEVNKVNGKNQTPINIAADRGHLGVVRFLLSKGADCTIVNDWGFTPLTNARAQGHAEVADTEIERERREEGGRATEEEHPHFFVARRCAFSTVNMVHDIYDMAAARVFGCVYCSVLC